MADDVQERRQKAQRPTEAEASATIPACSTVEYASMRFRSR